MTKETVVGFEPSLRAKYFDTEIAADVQNASELWYKSIIKTKAWDAAIVTAMLTVQYVS